MLVSSYLRKEFCVMDLKAQGKQEAIKEIIQKLAATDRVKDQDKFIKDVLNREALGSTGIGKNVAIPHARTDAVKGFIIGFGKSKTGIEFKSLDGEKVNLIFIMGADPSELNLYLRILAELSKLVMNDSFRRSLLSSVSETAVIEAVQKFERG